MILKIGSLRAFLNIDIFKKALQGSKNDYWQILSITANVFYYYLFRTEDKLDYQFFRKRFLKNPLYIKSNDETVI